MVLQVEDSLWEKLVQTLVSQGVLRSPKVIAVMRSVPREMFLPENVRAYGATDTPLPIGFGQTASAPHSLRFISELGETWLRL